MDAQFKGFFIERVARNFGRWVFVSIGKAEPSTSPQSSAASLNGGTAVGTLSPATPPEVSHLTAEGGGDYCLPYYSAASAAAHLMTDSDLAALEAPAHHGSSPRQVPSETVHDRRPLAPVICYGHRWRISEADDCGA